MQDLKKQSLVSKLLAFAQTSVLHFMLIGVALFLLTRSREKVRDPETFRIVITPGHVNSLIAKFERGWKRPPQPPELRGLVEELVKEEICVREALAMSLDRDDPLIQRRLRQKFEELTAPGTAVSEPTEAELKAFLEKFPEALGNLTRSPSNATDPASGRGDKPGPPFEEIRDLVRNEWFAFRRAEALDEQYEKLRSRYEVTVERPAP